MKKQATWVDQIVHSMTEQQAAIGRLFSNDMPQWAIRMFVEVTKVLGPGMQDGNRQKSEAYSIGALAGHQEKLCCKGHPFAQEFEKVGAGVDGVEAEGARFLHQLR